MGALIHLQQNVSIYKHLKWMELCVFCTISNPKDMLSVLVSGSCHKNYHSLGFINRNLFSHSSGHQTSETKATPSVETWGRACALSLLAPAGLRFSLACGTSRHSLSKVTCILFSLIFCIICEDSVLWGFVLGPGVHLDDPGQALPFSHLQYFLCHTK